MEITNQPTRILSYLRCGCVKERNGKTVWECKRHQAETLSYNISPKRQNREDYSRRQL